MIIDDVKIEKDDMDWTAEGEFEGDDSGGETDAMKMPAVHELGAMPRSLKPKLKPLNCT